MSRAPRLRRRPATDEGFTLVEVLVALTLLALVAAAVLPILVFGQRASTVVRFDTLGKNLTQERLEQLRQLPFQVDRQNGPFIDLLDNYYPSRVAAASVGATGWVAEASTARTADEPPTGAFYRTVVPVVPGQPDYRQRISLQFLRSDRAPVPAVQFPLYDSGSTTGLVGRDAPPSTLLSIRVTTAWTVNGRSRDFSVFSQIGDQGSVGALVTTQARAAALKIETRGPDETVIALSAGSVGADGRLSDGSTASVRADAGQVTRAGATTVRAASEDAAEPGGIRSGTPSLSAVTSTGTSDCGYAALGRSSVTGTTPSVTDGLPKLPATVGLTQVPAALATAGLLANSGGTCGILRLDNGSSASYDAARQLRPGMGLVDVSDIPGSNAVVEGAAWLNASEETATPVFAAAGATAKTTQRVRLLHPAFVTDGRGLVGVSLTSSSLTCSSAPTVAAAALTYRISVDAWVSTGIGTGARTTLVNDYTWSPGTVPSIDLSTVVHQGADGTVLRLSDYFSDLDLADSLNSGATKFIADLDSVFRATVKPVDLSRASSGLSVRLGSLSCVANDAR